MLKATGATSEVGNERADLLAKIVAELIGPYPGTRHRLAKKMTKLARDRASVEWDPRQYYYRRKPREFDCHGGHAKIDSIAPMKLGRIKGSKQGGITWRPYSRGGEIPSGLRPRIPAGNTSRSTS